MNRAVLEGVASAIVVVAWTVLVFELGRPAWAAIEARFDVWFLPISAAVFTGFGAVYTLLTGFRPRAVVAGAAVPAIAWPFAVEVAFGPTDSPVLFLFAAVLWVGFALGVGAVGLRRGGDRSAASNRA